MDNISQIDQVKRFSAVFPKFAPEWAADNHSTDFRSESLHSVYQLLLPFIARTCASDT